MNHGSDVHYMRFWDSTNSSITLDSMIFLVFFPRALTIFFYNSFILLFLRRLDPSFLPGLIELFLIALLFPRLSYPCRPNDTSLYIAKFALFLPTCQIPLRRSSPPSFFPTFLPSQRYRHPFKTSNILNASLNRVLNGFYVPFLPISSHRLRSIFSLMFYFFDNSPLLGRIQNAVHSAPNISPTMKYQSSNTHPGSRSLYVYLRP